MEKGVESMLTSANLIAIATAFTTIYDRAAYDLSLNYAEPPPPPPLSAEEQVWVRQRLSPSA